MNIALLGGGTAGHIIPNIALIELLKNYFNNIYYFGDINKMEHELTIDSNIDFIDQKSVKLDRTKVFTNLKILYLLPKYIHKSIKALKTNNINIVFSKGGYSSLPTVIAARFLNIPIICHESDITLGLTNKISKYFCDILITSFKNTDTSSKTVFIGNPLRKEIFNSNPDSVLKKYNINHRKKVLLIVGGSLGAKAINDIIYDSLDILTKNYFVIHITGKNKQTIIHKDYFQEEYVTNIFDYISASDLIVSRCGASLSGEITALNKKVLYIPLPKTSSRGDQIKNAKYLLDNNLALTLEQEKLNPTSLLNKLSELEGFNKDCYIYDNLIPDKIVDIIVNTAKKNTAQNTIKKNTSSTK